MSMKPLKIIFELDGSGISYDQSEPTHLDALLAWALAPFYCKGEPPTRDEVPFEIPLPLGRWNIDGHWGWNASALFPEGPQFDAMFFWRKRFRQTRAELTRGSPNTASGIYRDYNMPLPLLLAPRMVCWALGDRGRVEQILRKQIKYLGKKRSQGHGSVVAVRCEWCEEDFSISRNSRAMRWLPVKKGSRIVRTRPPYWNCVGATECCEVGEFIHDQIGGLQPSCPAFENSSQTG